MKRMRKILPLLLAMAILAALVPQTALADPVGVMGLQYTVTDGQATITGFTAPTDFSGNLVIPATLGGASVTSIGLGAFYNCTSLTAVTIPAGVTSIGEYAFADCTELAIIIIKGSDTSIGDSAFSNCTSLKSAILLDGVTSIGRYAFDKCTSLASITVPASVTSIHEHAFSECTGLIGAAIQGSNTSIGSLAFYKCTSLKNVLLLDGVTSIGAGAFLSCTNLISITIPAGVTSIGTRAFYDCPRLAGIDIPDTVTSIGPEAFFGCESLTSIVVPSGVTRIESRTFWCIGLTSITIPASVTSIADYAILSSGLTIYGYAGSCAQTYAVQHGCEFVDLTNSAVINPTAASFDRNPAKNADVSTTITWNEVTSVADVKNAGISIGTAAYAVSGNTLTIKKEYLTAQAEGSLALTVEFDRGNSATLTIVITDTLPPVEAGDKIITAVTPIGDINVPYGATRETIGLPAQVVAILNSGKSGTLNVSIAWNEGSPEYDGSTAGEYNFAGTLTNLPEGIVDPGWTVRVKVIVAASMDKTLVSIIVPANITGVANGAAKTAEALGLPTKVTLVTDDGDVQADVTWDVAACPYDPEATTEQSFKVNGAVTLPAGVINPNSVALSTSIMVTVEERVVSNPTITSITPVDDVEVAYGTEEAAAIAALAENTYIEDSDGHIHTVDLSWSVAGYNGRSGGVYTAVGTFALPVGVDQSDPVTELKVTAVVTVRPDTTPPVINATTDKNANDNGWFNQDVIVHFTAADNESGLASVTPDVTLTTEGARQSVTGTAVDNAGNSASYTIADINIDKTKPTVLINSPTSLPYLDNGSLTVDYTVADSLSGIDTEIATLDGSEVTNGQVISLADMTGNHTLTITTKDMADNENTVSVTFSVIIATTVDMKPDTLNLKSRGSENSITAYIEFPFGDEVNLVDAASVKITVNGTDINAQANPTSIGDYDNDSVQDLMVKFDRQQVIAAIGDAGDLTIRLSGSLTNGRFFEGSDVVKATEPGSKKK